ncbi:MAG TPA: DivIVA domain-containing protein [Mycobacteriales bacterium]|nr:DivIVA domain-containing protein [Mycobacteriales bacterium]
MSQGDPVVLALEVLVAVALIAATAVLAAGRGEAMSQPEPDRPDTGLPEGRPLRSDEVGRLRFPIAVRGYRMEDVDRALDAVAATLARFEAERARPAWLNSGADQPPADPASTGPSSALGGTPEPTA